MLWQLQVFAPSIRQHGCVCRIAAAAYIHYTSKRNKSFENVYMRKCTTCSLNCKSVCRLHEALQEVHRMLVRAPVPVNPFPAVSNIFLRYGCRLDLWDSRLVNIIIFLSFYGCTSALCCNLYCSLSVTAFCRLQSGTREGCSAEVVFLMYSMVQVMQPPCKLCKMSTSWNHHQHQRLVHAMERSLSSSLGAKQCTDKIGTSHRTMHGRGVMA